MPSADHKMTIFLEGICLCIYIQSAFFLFNIKEKRIYEAWHEQLITQVTLTASNKPKIMFENDCKTLYIQIIDTSKKIQLMNIN